ncbi:hypothetical protein BH10PSE11_BH10PSE11_13140 [soil metagenome]|jgi:hypothetical protein
MRGALARLTICVLPPLCSAIEPLRVSSNATVGGTGLQNLGPDSPDTRTMSKPLYKVAAGPQRHPPAVNLVIRAVGNSRHHRPF